MDDFKLIDAAEKHAKSYDDDDRECIKTDVLNAFYAGSKWATLQLTAERDALQAKLDAAKPVKFEYRWTNPANADNVAESMLDWGPIEPAWNQTTSDKIAELLEYRYEGKPCYEVRALYAAPPDFAALQAKLDALMMECCPDAMDDAAKARWGKRV